MAVIGKPFGKDKVVAGSSGYIETALAGKSGESEGISEKKIDRPNQSINTAVPADNVKLAMFVETSILDEGGWAGGVTNLGHSLSGASAVQADVGAQGKTKKTIFPDH
jgi:hypothetical protein